MAAGNDNPNAPCHEDVRSSKLLLRWNECVGGSRQDLTPQRRKLGDEKADHAVYQTEHLYSQNERVAPFLEFEQADAAD